MLETVFTGNLCGRGGILVGGILEGVVIFIGELEFTCCKFCVLILFVEGCVFFILFSLFPI